MKTTYKPNGVCSRLMEVSLDENYRIEDVNVIGGCPGNLIGLSVMCKGKDALETIEKLRGIPCGLKPSSCPDQMSYAIEAALREAAKNDLQMLERLDALGAGTEPEEYAAIELFSAAVKSN